MEQNSNVIIIEDVLQKNNVRSLADLADKPKLFCKVFKEIFNLMKKALLSGPEDKIPTPTLVVIRDDLFKLTNVLLRYYGSDYPIDNSYPLKDLNKIIDAARTEIIAAINTTKPQSRSRTKGIQNCRDKIIVAIEMINEFEHRRR